MPLIKDVPTWAAEVYCSSLLSILETTGEWDDFTVLLGKKQSKKTPKQNQNNNKKITKKQLMHTAQDHF